MSLMDASLLVLFGVGLGWVAGYYIGERRGVRDTEERWSDAVARKHDDDIGHRVTRAATEPR